MEGEIEMDNENNQVEYEQLDDDALARCEPGIRKLLRISEEELIRKKEIYDNRLEEYIDRVKKDSEKRDDAALGTQDVSSDSIESIRREFIPISHRIFGPVMIDPLGVKPIQIRAVIEFNGNANDLAGLGITVHTGIQNVFTITATRQQLADLATQAATNMIKLPRQFYPNLQDAVPTAEIDQIHALGNRGNGTIVGIVDSAFNVEHHAFRDPIADAAGNNNTRVLYYWVQDPDTLPGGGAPPGQTPQDYFNDTVNHPNSPDFTGLDYGRLYDADYIDAALSGGGNVFGTGAGEIAKEHSPLNRWGNPTADHGTHVAGIAAGSGHLAGFGSAPVNIGSAPLADIVYVNYRWSHANLQDGIWEDDVVNALEFIMQVATREGRPVVTNTSLGTNVGPHNGRSAFDTSRNALLDSHHGRSMVFTAGNDNTADGFREGTVTHNSSESFNMTPNSFNVSDIWVDIWYLGPDLDFKMDCGTQTTGWVLPPNDYTGTINNYDIEVERNVEPGAGLKGIRLYIDNAGTAWTVNLRNNHATQDVQYWAWTGGQGDWADLTGATHDEMTIGDTGCARAVLTVGACEEQIGGNPELIVNYSSRGPTLDGRIKPEIAAVGRNVLSADSRNVGGYIAKGGTSMAAPLAAGAIALLFEDQPNLNQDAIKGLLTQNADRTNLDIDPGAAGYNPIERNAYGFGRLRMLAPFQFIQPPGSINIWVRTATDDFGLEPYPGDCFCGAPEIKVFDQNGVETTTLHWNQEHTVQVRIHNLGDGVAPNVTAELKYTRPWAAPDNWTACQDNTNTAITQSVNVPALDYVDLTFTQLWRPQVSELPAGGASWGDHYCLLIELNHNNDPLNYDNSAASGVDAWTRNIKGTNNVALRNLHIQ